MAHRWLSGFLANPINSLPGVELHVRASLSLSSKSSPSLPPPSPLPLPPHLSLLSSSPPLLPLPLRRSSWRETAL